MLLDLVHGKLDKILVDLATQRCAQIVGIGLAQHAERARRSDQDQRLGLARIDLGIEMPEQLVQEFVLLLP
jgi:hypothetical protein